MLCYIWDKTKLIHYNPSSIWQANSRQISLNISLYLIERNTQPLKGFGCMEGHIRMLLRWEEKVQQLKSITLRHSRKSSEEIAGRSRNTTTTTTTKLSIWMVGVYAI